MTINVESFISFLSHSDWVFLTGLILLLAAACAVTFSEKPRQGCHRPMAVPVPASTRHW
jgi:hypothetical protein